jgi:hypothetical protein
VLGDLLVIFNEDLPLTQNPGMEFNAVSEAWEGGPRTTDDLLRPSDRLRMKECDDPRTTHDHLRPSDRLRMKECDDPRTTGDRLRPSDRLRMRE